MTKHRVTCEDPDCGRVWRENCRECAEDTAARHRAETGHPVGVTIGDGEVSMRDLRGMTRRAHRVLYSRPGR